MINYNEICEADLDTLKTELAAAGWSSECDSVTDARRSVGILCNEYQSLKLYDGDTGEVVESTVTNEQAAEAACVRGGFITVDGREFYVGI